MYNLTNYLFIAVSLENPSADERGVASGNERDTEPVPSTSKETPEQGQETEKEADISAGKCVLLILHT